MYRKEVFPGGTEFRPSVSDGSSPFSDPPLQVSPTVDLPPRPTGVLPLRVGEGCEGTDGLCFSFEVRYVPSSLDERVSVLRPPPPLSSSPPPSRGNSVRSGPSVVHRPLSVGLEDPRSPPESGREGSGDQGYSPSVTTERSCSVFRVSYGVSVTRVQPPSVSGFFGAARLRWSLT